MEAFSNMRAYRWRWRNGDLYDPVINRREECGRWRLWRRVFAAGENDCHLHRWRRKKRPHRSKSIQWSARLYRSSQNKNKKSGLTAEQLNEFFRIRGRENPYEDQLTIKIFTFRPSAPLGVGSRGLTFDATEMKGMVREWEATANDFIAALNPEDIAWV